MKTFITITTSLLLLSSISSFAKPANQKIGKVIKVKGQASLLFDHKKDPVSAAVGTEILEDTSISCSFKCYVTIELDNELSFVKVGSDSHISLRVDKDLRQVVVKLKKGFVKTMLKSTEKFQNIVVKTENATVQGGDTKFLTTFSPMFSKTSVLNYKGKTSFSKKDSSADSAVLLAKKQYSYLTAKMLIPNKPEILSSSRTKDLLNAFKVEDPKDGKKGSF